MPSKNRVRRVIFLFIWVVYGILPVLSQNTPDVVDLNCRYKFDSLSGRNIYFVVDEAPEYAGGDEAMWATIRQHLKWPGPYCCIQALVIVSFIVETDGTLSHVKVEKGLGNGICSPDDEAIAVVQQLKSWKPGRCKGQTVPVRKMISIRFDL